MTISHADFEASRLISVNFRGANLKRANLQNSSLVIADFQGANLQEANLQEANLIGSNMHGANLRRANLREAVLGQALFLATDLREVQGLTYEALDYETSFAQYSDTFSFDSGLGTVKLCNVALPSSVDGVDPNRDCDVMAQALVTHYERMSQKFPELYETLTLEQAQAIVKKASQKQWSQ